MAFTVRAADDIYSASRCRRRSRAPHQRVLGLGKHLCSAQRARQGNIAGHRNVAFMSQSWCEEVLLISNGSHNRTRDAITHLFVLAPGLKFLPYRCPDALSQVRSHDGEGLRRSGGAAAGSCRTGNLNSARRESGMSYHAELREIDAMCIDHRTSQFLSAPPIRKQRRNEPCACGSGKKFKHCHGRFF